MEAGLSLFVDAVWVLAFGTDSGIDINIAFGEGIAGGAVGTFLTTVIVGAILVTFAPEYTERMMASVHEEPVESVAYGLLALLVLFVLTILLVLTIFGILVAIPLVIAAYVVWAIGATIAYLVIADRLVGIEDGWLKPLVVAGLLNAVLVLTGIGGLISLVIGAAGFGAVLRDLF